MLGWAASHSLAKLTMLFTDVKPASHSLASTEDRLDLQCGARHLEALLTLVFVDVRPASHSLAEYRGQTSRGGHYIGDCIPTCDQGQSEVKRSRRIFGAGQTVKVGFEGSLETVKGSPGDCWAWLMLDSQGSRPDFRCGQGVKHKNLMGQDLDRGRGWKYRRLCSVFPLDLTLNVGLGS